MGELEIMAATQQVVPEPRVCLNHGLLLLFPRYIPQTGQREKEGLCAFVGILKDFSILMKTLSHYCESV